MSYLELVVSLVDLDGYGVLVLVTCGLHNKAVAPVVEVALQVYSVVYVCGCNCKVSLYLCEVLIPACECIVLSGGLLRCCCCVAVYYLLCLQYLSVVIYEGYCVNIDRLCIRCSYNSICRDSREGLIPALEGVGILCVRLSCGNV